MTVARILSISSSLMYDMLEISENEQISVGQATLQGKFAVQRVACPSGLAYKRYDP